MNSSVTLAISDKIKSGPWIFWNDMERNINKAKELGFDGVELFSTNRDDNFKKQVSHALEKSNIKLSAVGTGAGKALMKLTLTDEDSNIRNQAINFIKEIISFGAEFNAPAIIGSMQGFIGKQNRQTAIHWLSEALKELGDYAENLNVPLIYEPLNRYETDIFNTIETTVDFLEINKLDNVQILADLFHMNIEETSIPLAFNEHGHRIGHIHFADSNRRPVGFGHTNYNEIALAIKNSSFNGYISAEAFPYPDSDMAAQKTIEAFKHYFFVKHE